MHRHRPVCDNRHRSLRLRPPRDRRQRHPQRRAAGSRRHRLQQLPHDRRALRARRAARDRSPARQRPPRDGSGCRRQSGRAAARARTGLSGPVRSAPARPRARPRARGRDQRSAPARQSAGVPDAGRNCAGPSDRDRVRPRRSAPDLSRRRQRLAARRPAPARRRHRRRQHRIHHRPGLRGAGARERADRLRRQHTALLRGRQADRQALAPGLHRDRGRAAAVRGRLPQPRLGRGI